MAPDLSPTTTLNLDSLLLLSTIFLTIGMLAGVKMSHAALTSLCRAHKLACELYPSREVAICIDPYCGFGFILWCMSSIHSGHHTILIPPVELETSPGLWLQAIR